MLTLVSQFLAVLPLSIIHRIGVAIGWALHIATPASASIMRQNITQSGLATTDAQREQLITCNIAETGKAIVETLAIWQLPQAKALRLVNAFDGWPLVEAALARGKGIVFLTPHLGCFEIASIYYGAHHPLTVLFRPPKKSWLSPMINAGRSKGHVTLAPANVQGVRSLMQALKRGEAVGILPDQIPAEGEGEWADFFGKPAYTMTLASRLAEKTGAAVFMVFGERLPNSQGYAIHVSALADGEINTPAGLNHAIERQIAQHPAQYLWRYNRYKVRRGSKKQA
jgi:KDO2-lipid IV(A) lauroyltransferase